MLWPVAACSKTLASEDPYRIVLGTKNVAIASSPKVRVVTFGTDATLPPRSLVSMVFVHLLYCHSRLEASAKGGSSVYEPLTQRIAWSHAEANSISEKPFDSIVGILRLFCKISSDRSATKVNLL